MILCNLKRVDQDITNLSLSEPRSCMMC